MYTVATYSDKAALGFRACGTARPSLLCSIKSIQMGGEAAPAWAGATEAEKTRFLKARQGDEAAAAAMFQSHEAWRAQSLPLAKDAPALGKGLPLLAKVLTTRCRKGRRTVLVLGAMYDPNLGSAPPPPAEPTVQLNKQRSQLSP